MVEKIEGVAAVIRNSETGSYLICKRSENKDMYPSCWEFPGGGLEDEKPEEGVRRELEEELDLRPEIVRAAGAVEYESDHGIHKTYVFLAETSETEFDLSKEHKDYRWIKLSQLDRFEGHPGNRAYVEALDLEREIE